jgi:hypothetical protein
MTTHTPTRWTTLLTALMMLVATACADVDAAPLEDPGVGGPSADPNGETPDDEEPDPFPVVPGCPSQIPGTFC